MESEPVPSSPARKLIAPLWHTGLVLLVVATLIVLGTLLQKQPASAPKVDAGGKATLYLSLIAAQYGLYRLVRLGVRRANREMSDVVGENQTSAKAIAIDLLIAGALWAVSVVVLEGMKRLLGGVDDHANALLPQTNLESVLWAFVSIAAGIGEEIVYRGYLQHQFLALSGSATVAILGQAVLFGVSHSYQGVKSVAMITMYGALFGILAYYRRSIRPGIMAHAWTDIVGGLFRS